MPPTRFRFRVLSQRVEQHFTLSIEAIISNDVAKILKFTHISKFFPSEMNIWYIFFIEAMKRHRLCDIIRHFYTHSAPSFRHSTAA